MKTAPITDTRKLEAAAKRAAHKATRLWVKAHNASIEAARAATAAHEAQWGVDGYECA